MNQSWRSNVQPSDYRQQYCIIDIKLANRIDFNYPTTKKKEEK